MSEEQASTESPEPEPETTESPEAEAEAPKADYRPKVKKDKGPSLPKVPSGAVAVVPEEGEEMVVLKTDLVEMFRPRRATSVTGRVVASKGHPVPKRVVDAVAENNKRILGDDD